jgi:hypothetical protein
MRVSIFSDTGELLWWREANPPAGFTSANYLRDGVQDQIIGALTEALEQATGQLSCGSLEIVDAVSDVGTSATKIKRHVPIAVVWNRDAGR